MEHNQKKLLRALLTPVVSLELVFRSLIVNRRVDTAVGATLTLLGKLVGQPRNGVDDDEVYRRYVRARIAANKSSGRIRDSIKVAKLVVGDTTGAARFHVQFRGPAQSTLTIEGIVIDIAIADVIISFLRDTVADGVRKVLEYWPEESDEMFTFDSAAGLPTGGKGFGATFDASLGGELAGALE